MYALYKTLKTRKVCVVAAAGVLSQMNVICDFDFIIRFTIDSCVYCFSCNHGAHVLLQMNTWQQ